MDNFETRNGCIVIRAVEGTYEFSKKYFGVTKIDNTFLIRRVSDRTLVKVITL